jgi:hypothetical protein
MSSKQLLLPLFCVKKTAKKSINEKGLVTILVLSTFVTFIVIFKNLPSNVAFNPNRNTRDSLVPITIESNNKQQQDTLDDVNKPPNLEPPPDGADDDKEDKAIKEKREKIKGVSYVALYTFGTDDLSPSSTQQ